MELARTDDSARRHSLSNSSQSRSSTEQGEPAAAASPPGVQLMSSEAQRRSMRIVVMEADQDMRRDRGTHEEPPSTSIRRFTVTVLAASSAGSAIGYGISRLVDNPSIYFSGACTTGGFVVGALAGVVLYNRAPCLQDRR